MTDAIALVPVRPDSEVGLAALRRYGADLLERWHGSVPAAGDVEAFVHSDPDRLVPPDGVLLVALVGDDRADGPEGTEAVVACGGLRYGGRGVPAGAGEIKRMWVDPAQRGRGLGRRLLARLTELAREAGLRRLVLDTRADLVEARALYGADGFVEVESYNANPDAQVWYAKELR